MPFPSPATNGQTYTAGGFVYTFNATNKTWVKTGYASNVEIGNVKISANTSAISIGNTSLSANGLFVGNTSVTSNSITVGNILITSDRLTIGTTTITSDFSTSNVSEGSNLYYTNARVLAGISRANVTNLTVTGNIVAGNVVATRFVGDGSQLTGITATSTSSVSNLAQLPTYNGNALIGNIVITGNASTGNILVVQGNAVITGNLVVGNVIATRFLGDGSQLTGITATSTSSVSNLAQLPTYNGNALVSNIVITGNASTGNILVVQGNASITGNLVVGNVFATRFIGDGSQLTGITASGGASVSNLAQLPTYNGNALLGNLVISGNATTGNILIVQGNVSITGNLVVGNVIGSHFGSGSGLTGISTSIVSEGTNLYYTNARVLTGVTTANITNLTVTGNVVVGNIYATRFVGDGSQLTGIDASAISGVNLSNLAQLPTYNGNALVGNIVVSGNATTGNILTVLGNASITGNLVVGNVFATRFVGDGSQLTGITAAGVSGVNRSNLAQLPTYNGNALVGNIVVTGNATLGNILVVQGNASIANLVITGKIFGDGSGLTGLVKTGDSANFQGKSTTDLAEGTNLYYTNARVYSNVASLLANYSGNIRAGNVLADSFVSTGTGVPTIISDTNINLYANNAVVIANSVLRLRSYSTTDRNNIIGQNGDLIYNSSNNSLQIYSNGGWVDVSNITTNSVVEGSNLYFTNARVLAGITKANIANLTITGNIVAGNVFATRFVGDGSQLTGITATSTSSVSNLAQLPTYNGNALVGNIVVTGNATTGNILTVVGNASITGNLVVGNVFATRFVGDGSQLTGITATSTSSVSNLAQLPTYNGNALLGNLVITGNATTGNVLVVVGNVLITGNVIAGNITATRFVGDGSQLTGIVTTLAGQSTSNLAEGTNLYYTNARVLAGVTEANITNITVSGNIVAGNVFATRFVGDGSQLTGITASGGASVSNLAQLPTYNGNALVGNLVISGNATLGNVLTVVGNAVITGNLVVGNLSLSGGSIRSNPDNNTTIISGMYQYKFTDLGTAILPNVNAAGNIIAGKFVGDGSLLTNVLTSLAGQSTSNLAEGTNLYYTNARVISGVASANIANLTVTGNIIAGNVIGSHFGDGSKLTGITTSIVAEGTNLYYTNARVINYITNVTISNLSVSNVRLDQYSSLIASPDNNTTIQANAFNYVFSESGFAILPNVSITTNININDKLVVSPTARLAGNIVPLVDNVYNLGSPTNRFRSLYVSGSTIDIGSAQFKFEDGKFKFQTSDGAPAQTEIYTSNVIEQGDTTTGNVYFTNTRARAALSGGTGVTYDKTTGAISIGQNVSTTADVIFKDGTFTGNLVVQGDTVVLNTSVLNVEDKNILLANGAINATAADGAGISIAGANANILYASSTDRFTTNKTFDVTGNLFVSGNISVSGNVVAGNVTATRFVGDGSQLTGITASGVAGVNTSNLAQLPTYNGNALVGNIVVTGNATTGNILVVQGSASITGNLIAGNITATRFVGDGSQLTGITASAVSGVNTSNLAQLPTYNGNALVGNIVVTGNATTGNILTVVGNAVITGNLVVGNVTATRFVGDGSLLSGILTSLAGQSTSNLAEGTNLYYTNARAILAAIPAVTQLVVTTPVFNYNIDQYSGDNPTIYVNAGETISFELNQGASHPFAIRVSNGGSNYNTGLTHVDDDGTISTGSGAQGKYTGELFWKIPYELAGNTYVYQCTNHSSMVGNIVIQKSISLLSTSDVTEGTNLYYTNARVIAGVSQANISNLTVTGNIVVGNVFATRFIGDGSQLTGITASGISGVNTSNLAQLPTYNGNALIGNIVVTGNASTGNILVVQGNAVITGNLVTGNVAAIRFVGDGSQLTGIITSLAGQSTSNLAEGTNLYYTNARVLAGVTTANITNLTVTGNIVVGNIYATRFVGDGSQLTGITASGGASASNLAQLPTYNGNALVGNIVVSGNATTGNVLTVVGNAVITGNLVVGNLLLSGGSIRSNPDNNTTIISGMYQYKFTDTGIAILPNVNAAGNIIAGKFVGDGSLLTNVLTSLAGQSTSNLAEGTNLYYTNARVITGVASANIANLTVTGNIVVGNVFATRFVGNGSQLIGLNTTIVSEGTNLYYTNARVISHISNITIGNLTVSNVRFDPYSSVIASPDNNTTIQANGYNYVFSEVGFAVFPNLTITSNININDKLVVSPTARLAGNIVPLVDNVYSLGSATNRFKGLYVSGGTIDIGSALFKFEDGKFKFQTSDGAPAQTEIYTGNVIESGDTTVGNVYFTNTRARAALSGGTGVTYDKTTGAISIGQNVSTTSSVQFKDVTLSGNLSVLGTTTTINARSITISDNMLYLNQEIPFQIVNAVGDGANVVYTTALAHGAVLGETVRIAEVSPLSFNTAGYNNILAVTSNTITIASSVTDSYISGGNVYIKRGINPDIGFAGGYNDGTGYAHTGFFRDATDGTYKIYEGYLPEPDANIYIDTANSSFRLANLLVSNLTARGNIVTGNVIATKLFGDGSALTGISTSIVSEGTNLYYTNARVITGVASANIANLTVTGNIVVGNVTATRFVGDGSVLTGITTSIVAEGTNLYYTNARVLVGVASANISNLTVTGNIVVGNVYATRFVGDGSQLTGVASSGALSNLAQLQTYNGNILVGNLVVTGNAATGNILVVSGNAAVTGNLFVANLLVGGFIGRQGGLGNLVLLTGGNIVIDTGPFETRFFDNGNVSFPGNVIATRFIGDGTGLTGIITSLAGQSTSNLAEGTNLYYTNARVLNYVSNVTLSNLTVSNLTIRGNLNLGNNTSVTTVNDNNTIISAGSFNYTFRDTGVADFPNLNVTGNITLGGVLFGSGSDSNAEIRAGAYVYQFNDNGSAVFPNLVVNTNLTIGGAVYSTATDNNTQIRAGIWQYTFTDTGNLLVPNIVVSGKLFGDGSQLTGITASGGASASNLAQLPTYNGNALVGNIVVSGNATTGNVLTVVGNAAISGNLVVGNVFATRFVGDGSVLTGITTSIVAEGTNLYYTNARVLTGVTTANIANLTVTGNIVVGNVFATRFVGDGSQLTGITASGGASASNLAQLPTYNGNALVGNIVVTGNATSGNAFIVLGNAAVTGNLFVANLLVGGFIGRQGGVSNLTLLTGGNLIIDTGPFETRFFDNGNVSFPGNVIASSFFVGNGSLLTGITASASLSGMSTYAGNILATNIVVTGSATLPNVTVTSNLTVQGNILVQGNLNLGIGSSLATVSDSNTRIRSGTHTYTFGDTGVATLPNVNVTGNLILGNTFITTTADNNTQIRAGIWQYTFGDTGVATFPNINISGNVLLGNNTSFAVVNDNNTQIRAGTFVSQFLDTGNLSVGGNIIATGRIVGDGSSLSNIVVSSSIDSTIRSRAMMYSLLFR